MYVGSKEATDREGPLVTKLPSDAELKKLWVLGRTNREIAEQYHVSIAAVDYRYKGLGLRRRPIVNQVRDLLNEVWPDLKSRNSGPTHHNLSPGQSLKAWLRFKLGDKTLPPRTLRMAETFEDRLRRDNVVLAYNTLTAWSFVPREPEDGTLAIRWPSDVPRPTGERAEVWQLRDE